MSKQTTGTGTSDAFIPLYFARGDALQFDWSEEYVLLGGVEHKVHVAHFRLCHSRKPFVVAYLNEKQEIVLVLVAIKDCAPPFGKSGLRDRPWRWRAACPPARDQHGSGISLDPRLSR